MFDPSNSVQAGFDELYQQLLDLLNLFYQQMTITVTSTDQDFINPAIMAHLTKFDRGLTSIRRNDLVYNGL